MIYLLPHLLPETAEHLPDQAAVAFGADRLSYAGLEDESARLAASLVDAGVRRGDRVGIWFNKSARSVTSVFAVLRTGALYVPLDPMSPRSRVAAIMRDCGIRHVITTARKLATLDGAHDDPAPRLDAALLVDEGGPLRPRPAPAWFPGRRRRRSTASPQWRRAWIPTWRMSCTRRARRAFPRAS